MINLFRRLLFRIRFIGLTIEVVMMTAVSIPALAQPNKHVLRSNPSKNFTFDVNPETFSIVVDQCGVKEQANKPLLAMQVSHFVKLPSRVAWIYPDLQLSVIIEKKTNYLDITINSGRKQKFGWPSVIADSYMLPLGEGKYIYARDSSWRKFLTGQRYNFLESFSMGFFALNKMHYAIVYIVKNVFNNTIQFESDPLVRFSFSHNFTSIDRQKTYGFRLYVTDNTPKAIAAVYKNYIIGQGRFETLEQKAVKNPNIRKLYGAPQIYLWTHGVIAERDVNWQGLLECWKKNQRLTDWIVVLLNDYVDTDLANEFKQALAACELSGAANNYQKLIILQALNKSLGLKELYNPEVFKDFILSGKIDELSEQQLYALNKQLLKSQLKEVIDRPESWGSVDIHLLDELHKAGIIHAWIGLPDWADGLMNPGLIAEANRLGYLVGPYDCYNDIQQARDRSWDTAWFPDTALYEHATVSDSTGVKIAGFAGRGRALNPTLSLPSVIQRVAGILRDKIPYNSWFVDCDAFGQVYDDYSPAHITTQQQDYNARLARMVYVGQKKGMVIGSEGGNDYASRTIVFAQGLEMTIGRWDDPDLRANKDSPYFLGAYWAPPGGIPAIFIKTVPLKPRYRDIYVNPANSLPLFRLVYNNSVITTAHWTFGSLKIKNDIGTRMLSELLYNTPPLYHIDEMEWERDKKNIISHVAVWTKFHRLAIKLPMTDFQVLSPDRSIQRTTFGNSLSVTVNFSYKNARIGHLLILARSALINYGSKRVLYSVRNIAD